MNFDDLFYIQNMWVYSGYTETLKNIVNLKKRTLEQYECDTLNSTCVFKMIKQISN